MATKGWLRKAENNIFGVEEDSWEAKVLEESLP
jgi:hypothetical protein